MSTIEANTLIWVKSEIDETLTLAQTSLEAYVEDTADESQLRFCINYLHQVHGTLQMVELYGAALAIDEMEKLSQAIFDDAVSNKEDAYETLMRGILQMPDYLEHLLAGNPEMPVVLLPLLNDIRAARNAPLLSEGALFTPDLSVTAPLVKENNGGNLVEAARKSRHEFHRGLLSWFKNENPKIALQNISNVLTHLVQAAESDEARRVFWIANGFIDSLKEGGIETNAAIKTLMGGIDRQIKKIIDNGAHALDDEPPEELEKNLLYYVALSTTDGPLTKEIKVAFNLKNMLPDKQTVELARADLEAPNAALMGTVSAVIIEDITKIQDNLDLFVRADEKDMSVVDEIHSSLVQMADTLAMLNLGEQREAVLKQAAIIKSIAGGILAAEESEMMGVAAAMIAVEKSMKEIPISKSVTATNIGGGALGEMQATEKKILLRAVLAEAKINLAKVKNALNEFNGNSEISEQLKSIPALLEQIQGSFKILSLEEAANLFTLTNNYIIKSLIKEEGSISEDDMNNLADAISSLEYYMESLSGEWGTPKDILEIAKQSLQTLGLNLDEPADLDVIIEDDSNLKLNSVDNDKISIDELMLDEPLTLEDSEEDIHAEDITLIKDIIQVSSFAKTESSKVSNLLDDTIDEEIIEIFMEEADEAYTTISELLPIWIQNTTNSDALKEMRRAYHTLKGSGRLVGALDLGEFSWAFENMLNHVLDGTINISPEILELMENGRQALPELFELFKTNSKPAENILLLMQAADEFSKGKTVIEDDDVEDFPINIDVILLDIYRKEVATHCDSLQQYIKSWNNDEKEITKSLLRALHTLTGSSRTTGVKTLAKLCSSFESYAKYLQDIEMGLPDIALLELGNLISIIASTVACLDKVGATLPEHESLLARIEALPKDFENVVALVRENTETTYVETSDSDYDEELLEIFIEEATEIIDESDHLIHEWIEKPDDPSFVTELQRHLHTLKGGARMVGVAELGDLGHSLESLLTMLVDDKLLPSKTMFDLVVRVQDRLVQMLDLVKAHEKIEPASELIAAIDDMLANKSVANKISDETDIIEFESKSETAQEEHDDLLSIDLAELEELEEKLRLDLDTLNVEDDINFDLSAEGFSATEINLEKFVEEEESIVERSIEKPLVMDESADFDITADVATERRNLNRGQVEQVRVRADLLDNLVNFAGEVSIYRSRLEQQTNNFRYNITEFDDTVNRLREQMRQFEIETETQIEYKSEELSSAQEKFDPLEMDRFTTMQHLSRAMMESLSDLDSLRGIFNNLTRESETLLLQQSRVNTDLQEGLMRTRMVPFSGQAGRLRRIIRQTCDELGKKANFRLEGIDVELDRSVLERIISPIEHMLRNAVAHGIETPEERKRAGKPEEGSIHFSIVNEGSDILIRITDDGAGINLAAIRNKAIEKDLIKADDDISKAKLLDMIMQSGFSTAESVSQISGRGVGMDVVNTEIKQLGGIFNIDTEDNKGTTFTITLPLTLAISRALMVVVGEDIYAVPLLSVKGIERIRVKEIKAIMASEEKVYAWADKDYKFLQLATVMGGSPMDFSDDEQQLPVLIVRSGEYRAAILVDSLLGSREIVVKSVGPQLSTLRGISGATVMGDGSVVLILDLAMLIRLSSTQDIMEGSVSKKVYDRKIHKTNTHVMVVDDSITVRKVTARLLARHSMDVVVAKDGVDALLQLQEIVPDIMLLDVEMPRMDGFELATNMRNDNRLKNIPIIMITSRTGKKHRERAASIGVDIYMGKPFTETDLLENINALLAENV